MLRNIFISKIYKIEKNTAKIFKTNNFGYIFHNLQVTAAIGSDIL